MVTTFIVNLYGVVMSDIQFTPDNLLMILEFKLLCRIVPLAPEEEKKIEEEKKMLSLLEGNLVYC